MSNRRINLDFILSIHMIESMENSFHLYLNYKENFNTYFIKNLIKVKLRL